MSAAHEQPVVAWLDPWNCLDLGNTAHHHTLLLDGRALAWALSMSLSPFVSCLFDLYLYSQQLTTS